MPTTLLAAFASAPRVVSLFAGIGGFDLGFSRAGCRVVAHVERDAHCLKLLAERWPEALAFDDVCTVGAHNLPSCDVLCGGWPCQDLSVAGKRAGLAGERSGLFYQFTRIAYELQPAFIVWENVPGLLSSDDGRDFARVLLELDRVGYGGAWRTLDAQWFGVAQRRRRVFGVFARLDLGVAGCAEILSLAESLRGHPAPRRAKGEGTAAAPAPCLNSGSNDTVGGGIPEVAWTLQERDAKGSDSDTKEGHLIPMLQGGFFDVAAFDERVITSPGNRSSVEPGSPCPSLNGGQMAIVPIQNALRGKSQNGLGIGDEGEPQYTLDQGSQHAIAFPANLSATQCAATEDLATESRPTSSCVRRLTPRECERLQGFPDDWTAGFSDSTRYRMLGNAVALPCAEWIARRLVAFVKVSGSGFRVGRVAGIGGSTESRPTLLTVEGEVGP